MLRPVLSVLRCVLEAAVNVKEFAESVVSVSTEDNLLSVRLQSRKGTLACLVVRPPIVVLRCAFELHSPPFARTMIFVADDRIDFTAQCPYPA